MMTEQSEGLNTSEPTILIKEIQKTIELDIQEGKIKRESLPCADKIPYSSNFLLTSTGFILHGMARFKQLFGNFSSVGDALGDGQNNNDSVVQLEEIEKIEPDKLNLGLIDNDFSRGDVIASGGQADIVNALDKQIGRVVAIKCLRENFQNSPGVRSNLMHEAVLTARLEHPVITPVYRLCKDSDENLHIVMKKIRGKTLDKYLEETRDYYTNSKVHIFEERSSLFRRLDIFLDVCNGLSYAHSQKAVHCDLKPDNIMIGSHRETYIIDWGIAKVLNDNGLIPGVKKIAGSPHYIAPEIVFGMDYDHRADVFSMGAILFEIVTLERAFSGNELKDLIENICTGNMNPIRHAYRIGIDKALMHIIRKATATHPAARYQKIDALAEDIRRYRNGLEIMAKPDNMIQHGLRWMSIHKRLSRWIIQLTLVGVFGFVGLNTYEKMQFELQQKRRETSLNNAYAKSLVVVMEINNLLNKTEQIASVLASETAFILDHHQFSETSLPANEPQKAFVSNEKLKGENPPDSSILSVHYNSRVDFSNLSYAAKNLNAKEIEHYLSTFLPFRSQIIGFFILSSVDKERFVGKAAILPQNMEKNNYSLRWLHLNFTNGLHLRYPASEFYGKDFNPADHLWYERARKSPDLVVWGEPTLDPGAGNKVVLTAAKAIISPQYEFWGVAGADITLDEISRIIEKNQADKYFKRMLLSSDGRILINTANPLFQPRNDREGKLNLPLFHNRDLFNMMTRKKFGFERVQENGKETFYVYTYLAQMQWYYVVRIDQDTIQYQDDWKKPSSGI